MWLNIETRQKASFHFKVVILLGIAGISFIRSDAPTSTIFAQDSQATSASNTAAVPTTVVEPGHVNVEFSRLYIFVDKSGAIGHQHAVEGKLQSGNVKLSGSMPGNLIFDMNSFDADTDAARKYLGLEGSTEDSTRKQVNANMRGNTILDVKRYPQATFENIRVQSKTTKSARGFPEILLTGNFTLHGKTQLIEVVADVEQANGWNHVRGSFQILQTNYGIKPFSKMLGAIGVKDALVIHGDLWIAP